MATPVFVDETGRRGRRVRRLGQALTACFALYLALVVASFLRAPWVTHLSLPGVGPLLPQGRPPTTVALGPNAISTPAPALTPTTQRSGPTTTAGNRGAATTDASHTATTATAGGQISSTTSTLTTTTVGGGQTTTTNPHRTTTTTTTPGSTSTSSTTPRSTTSTSHPRGRP